MKRILATLALSEPPASSSRDLRADQPRALRGWRTTTEIARELRFTETAKDPEDAVRDWLKRQGIATVRRGRRILVDEFDIQKALAKRA